MDLSSKNIILDEASFQVKIQSLNGVSLIKSSMSIFTSDVDDTVIIQPVYDSLILNTSSQNYSFRLFTDTKRIPSNQSLSYSLWNKKGENVSGYLMVQNNRIAKNDSNPLIMISSSIPSGIYYLRTSFGDSYSETKLTIGPGSVYTIYYHSNNDNNSVITQTYNSIQNFTLNPNSYFYTGYQYNGWNTMPDGSGEHFNDMQAFNGWTGDLHLYAEWIPNTYTVRFVANGGEGTMADMNFVYGVSQSLTMNTFTYDDHRFVAWCTEADGNGSCFSNGANVKDLTTRNEDVVILYAKWAVGDSYNVLNYEIDYIHNYVDFVSIATTLDDYKSHFLLGDQYRIEVELGEHDVIYTGSKTKIYKNDVLQVEFTNIVRGDINGDGAVNSGDLFRIRQHLLGVLSVEGAYWRAADTNEDEAINSGDLFRIRQHLLGVRLLS